MHGKVYLVLSGLGTILKKLGRSRASCAIPAVNPRISLGILTSSRQMETEVYVSYKCLVSKADHRHSTEVLLKRPDLCTQIHLSP